MRWNSHDAYNTVPSPPSYEVISLGVSQDVDDLTARTMSKVWGFCAQSSSVQYFSRLWYAGFFSSKPAASNVLFSSMVCSM
jgi:hypothetical protein